MNIISKIISKIISLFANTNKGTVAKEVVESIPAPKIPSPVKARKTGRVCNGLYHVKQMHGFAWHN